MLELGSHEGVIMSHRTKYLGQHLTVAVTVQVGEESAEAIIFMTEKSMGMARRN